MHCVRSQGLRPTDGVCSCRKTAPCGPLRDFKNESHGRHRDQDERFNRARVQEQEARGTGRHRVFGGTPPRRWACGTRKKRISSSHILFFKFSKLLMMQGAKRVRTAEPLAHITHTAEPSGRPQLLLVKTDARNRIASIKKSFQIRRPQWIFSGPSA
jgi:hypothetical protein